MALPVTISGIATNVACVGPFKSQSTVTGVESLVGAGNTTFGNQTAQERTGQTFTTVGAISPTHARFRVAKNGAPTDDLICELFATSGGTPTGSALCSASVNAAVITGTTTVIFQFDAAPSLSAATVYAVTLRRSGAVDVTNNYNVLTSASSSYSGGGRITYNGSSWGSLEATVDLNFAVGTISDTFYFFGKDSGGAGTLQAFKATDPTSSWASIATESFNTIEAIAGVQVNDVIHLAVIHASTNTSVNLSYTKFDTSIDSFVLDETIQTAFNPQDNSNANVYGCSICMQNSQPTILYNGARVANMGSSYAQLYERHRTGTNTWSSAVQVSAGGQVNFTQPEIIAGASNRGHMLYHNAPRNSSSTLQCRTLNSSYSLQTLVTLASQISTQIEAVSYDSSGTIKIVAMSKNTTPEINSIRFDSADVPTLSQTVIEATNPDDGWGIFVDTTTVYSMYQLASDDDLYVESSTDHGATWGSRTSAFVSTLATVASKEGNIYLRGSDYVIPYIVNDNGTLKYNEYVVRSIAPAFTWHPMMDAAVPAEIIRPPYEMVAGDAPY